jgi:hypothetical protein
MVAVVAWLHAAAAAAVFVGLWQSAWQKALLNAENQGESEGPRLHVFLSVEKAGLLRMAAAHL